MLDPFTSLSVASSVVQFVEFSGTLIENAQKIYKSSDRVPAEVSQLEESLARLQEIANTLDISVENETKEIANTLGISVGDETNRKVLYTPDQRSAARLADSCKSLAEKFQVTFRHFKPQDSLSKMKSLKLAFRLERKKGELATYEKELDGLRANIIVHVLNSVCGYQPFPLEVVFNTSGRPMQDHVVGTLATYTSTATASAPCPVEPRPLLIKVSKLTTCAASGRSEAAKSLDRIHQRCDMIETNIASKLDTLRSELQDSIEMQRQDIDMGKYLFSALTSIVREGRKADASQQILHSLRFDLMYSRRNAIAEHYLDTYEWIFDSDEVMRRKKELSIRFKEWLHTGRGIYWVSGKAGSGKSTMMKFLCNHRSTLDFLSLWANGRQLVCANHFFWNAGTDLQKSQLGLLRVLCFDILRACPGLIPTLCPERFEASASNDYRTQSWSLPQLLAVVQGLSTHLDGNGEKVCFCFFIDGLDEYRGDHRDLIAALCKLSSSENVKICASSRPWNVFQNAFGKTGDSMLTLQDLSRDDIRAYVSGHLSAHDNFAALRSQGNFCTQLIAAVVRKANGVFLWVFLVVRELLKSLDNNDSARDLKRRLDSMPPGLEDYFRHMFDTLEEFYVEQTAQIFLVCLHAKTALPLTAFAVLERDEPEAAQFTTDLHYDPLDINTLQNKFKGRVNARCRDLIEVLTSTTELVVSGNVTLRLPLMEVDFLHRTVRDFLRTDDMTILLQQRAGDNFEVLPTLCEMRLVGIKTSLSVFGNGNEDRVSLEARELTEYARDMESQQHRTPVTVLDQLEAVVHNAGPRLVIASENSDCFLPLVAQQNLLLYLKYRLEQELALLGAYQKPSLLVLALTDVLLEDADATLVMDWKVLKLVMQHGDSPNASTRMRPSDWDWFLSALQTKHKDCTGDLRKMLLQATEALIEGGAKYQTTVGPKFKYSEEQILQEVFGAEEARRLLRAHKDYVVRHLVPIWSPQWLWVKMRWGS